MFYDKLNYKEDGFYSVVDQVELTNGEYKGVLNHDHVDRGTILIIDEEGNEIKDYFISDNPEKPWETEIELFGPKGVKIAYIHYNTKGDIVDADDINKIQDVISKDDGALDKVKEDIIVLKETKSDKRYVDRELNKKLDNDSFLEVMEEVADKKADKDKIIDIVNQNIKDLDIEDEVHHVSGIEEANIVRDFENGITISPVSNRNQFPSIDAFGVSITFINKLNGGYGQMVITSNGDTWTRRTNSLTSWGTWYSTKSEIDKKADKDYVDEKIGDIDFTTLEIEIDKKADKDYVDDEVDGVESLAWDFWMELNTDKADRTELDRKADKSYVDNNISRTSTIVIANYDSHENSKKGADIVINKGDDFANILKTQIENLRETTGGAIYIAEGSYNCEQRVNLLSEDNFKHIQICGSGDSTIINNLNIDIRSGRVDYKNFRLNNGKITYLNYNYGSVEGVSFINSELNCRPLENTAIIRDCIFDNSYLFIQCRVSGRTIGQGNIFTNITERPALTIDEYTRGAVSIMGNIFVNNKTNIADRSPSNSAIMIENNIEV